MSKAFTKESESDSELNEPKQTETLSKNTKNYVTPFGFSQLQNELRQLVSEERPKIVATVKWAAGNGDRSENGDYIYGKKRLREIDRRVRYLTKRLETAKVIDPKQQTYLKQIFFGATVSYSKDDNQKTTVKIVGIDEADLEKGKISWISPMAKALLKSSVGDTITLETPSGRAYLTIESIDYLSED